METLPVTLIVKAPNQQIEDQTIKCEPSWTINKLKQHLSEVYPSKPPKHEQKLIYSGQLLSDTLVLKDVLRKFEGQETHTVHLVCTPKHIKSYQTESNKANQPPSLSTNETIPNVSQNLPNTSAPNQGVPNISLINHPGVIDPVQYTAQVAMMQQAYIQYISQYMQLAANSYANGMQIPTPQAPGTAQQVPQQQAPQPQPVQAQAEPENPERDWLDMFYMLTRAMVLFSVVYFYSSPIRFIFVLMLGIGIYLYQMGFFRNINNNNNNNNNVPTDPVRQEEEAPSRFMVMWTFFATFFASLIPEIPNPI